MSPQSLTLEERIVFMENLFQHSLSQVQLLNQHIRDLSFRYRKASQKKHMSGFRCSIRIRLNVVQGVRGMYYEYSLMLADKLDLLLTRAGANVIGAHPEHWEDSEEDEMNE